MLYSNGVLRGGHIGSLPGDWGLIRLGWIALGAMGLDLVNKA